MVERNKSDMRQQQHYTRLFISSPRLVLDHDAAETKTVLKRTLAVVNVR